MLNLTATSADDARRVVQERSGKKSVQTDVQNAVYNVTRVEETMGGWDVFFETPNGGKSKVTVHRVAAPLVKPKSKIPFRWIAIGTAGVAAVAAIIHQIWPFFAQ